jgi:hypothetical protein
MQNCARRQPATPNAEWCPLGTGTAMQLRCGGQRGRARVPTTSTLQTQSCPPQGWAGLERRVPCSHAASSPSRSHLPDASLVYGVPVSCS